MVEGFPRWAAEEVAKANWQYGETWKGSGFILKSDEENKRLDVQFYEKLPDGRYIVENIDLSNHLEMSNLKLGEVYLFELKVYEAQLSKKLTDFLLEQYQTRLDSVHRFELASFETFEE